MTHEQLENIRNIFQKFEARARAKKITRMEFQSYLEQVKNISAGEYVNYEPFYYVVHREELTGILD